MRTFYAKLTKKATTYGLPVVQTFSNPKPVTVNGVQHPRTIFTLWSDKELKAIGYARVEENTWNTKTQKSTGYKDVISSYKVIRTHTLTDTPTDNEKVKLKSTVNSIRLVKINGGINISVANTTYGLDTTTESRNNITGISTAISAGMPLPLTSNGSFANTADPASGTHISWRTADNQDILVDGNTFIISIASKVLDHINKCHLVSRVKKEEIEQLTTWTDIEGYDLYAGWPSTLSDNV